MFQFLEVSHLNERELLVKYLLILNSFRAILIGLKIFFSDYVLYPAGAFVHTEQAVYVLTEYFFQKKKKFAAEKLCCNLTVIFVEEQVLLILNIARTILTGACNQFKSTCAVYAALSVI